MVEAIFVNYRRGRNTQKPNQMIIMIPNCLNKKDAEKYVGSEVIYTNFGKNKKQIKGKVTFAHGNSGCVRALFEKGLPGQAIGQKVEVKK